MWKAKKAGKDRGTGLNTVLFKNKAMPLSDCTHLMSETGKELDARIKKELARLNDRTGVKPISPPAKALYDFMSGKGEMTMKEIRTGHGIHDAPCRRFLEKLEVLGMMRQDMGHRLNKVKYNQQVRVWEAV